MSGAGYLRVLAQSRRGLEGPTVQRLDISLLVQNAASAW